MLSALLILLAGAGPQDSIAILQGARAAQGSFERARRGQLPLALGGASSRCDERIGQFCYWYDARESDPPAEGPAISGGREVLLVELGAAAQRLPTDPWLAGQRVRYLLEARRPAQAQQLAAECAAKSTWCGMLLGWALHAGGEVPAADTAFDRALAAMPDDERCRWLDLGLVLPSGQARAWRALPCPARAEQSERWLELGRGLMAIPGNSVRTEMLSRQVIVRVVDGTVTPYGMRFDAAHREMVLRYGWPVGWSRVPGRWANEEATIIGHDPSPAWGLLPSTLEPPRWDNAAERPRARFQPPGVTALLELDDVQMARFPRGAGILLVAAWAVPPAHPLNTPGATGVLSVQSQGGAPGVVGRVEEGRAGTLAFEAPGGATLAGLELLHPGGSSWALHREYWPVPLAASGPLLSDLLLFEPDSVDLPGLDAVLPRANAGTTLRRGATVGVYWEWSGLPAGQGRAVTRLEVIRERGGSPVLSWSWPGGDGAGASGAATMELNLARLGAGRYHLDLIMTVAGQVVRSRRPFQVR